MIYFKNLQITRATIWSMVSKTSRIKLVYFIAAQLLIAFLVSQLIYK